MKKILSISGIFLGIILLAGCGQKVVPTTSSQPSVPQTKSSDNSGINNSADNSTINLPTTPAKTTDIDSSLNQVDKDLNSIDAMAPDLNDLNSADLQK